MKDMKDNDVFLQVITMGRTMIEPAKGWIEIHSVPSVKVDRVASKDELAWLTRYPLPNKTIFDRCNKFLAKLRSMMVNDYGILCNSTSIRNPQVNAIIKMHTKPWVILNIPLKCKIWIWIMKTLGEEFSHLLSSPYSVRYTLPRSIHRHNWSLVRMCS